MPCFLLILYSAIYGRFTAPTLGKSAEDDDDEDEDEQNYLNTPRLEEFESSNEENTPNTFSSIFSKFAPHSRRMEAIYIKKRHKNIYESVIRANGKTPQINAYLYRNGKPMKTQITLLNILEILEKRTNTVRISPKYSLIAIICSSAMGLLAPIYRIITLYNREDLNMSLLSQIAFGSNLKRFIVLISLSSTWIISLLILMYYTYLELLFRITDYQVKCFCSMTSLEKTKKYKIPYFRLHNIENIHMWLSVRSIIKRSVNATIGQVILSGSIIFLLILACFVMAPLILDDFQLYTTKSLEYWYFLIILCSLGYN